MEDIGVMIVGFAPGVGSMIARMLVLLGVSAARVVVRSAPACRSLGEGRRTNPRDAAPAEGEYEAALRRAASADIDLVLLHWPGAPSEKDAAAFVKTIRESANALQPIVAVAGAGDRRGATAAVAAGVHECLNAPLSAERLKDCIVRHVLSSTSMVKTAGYFGPDRRRD